MASAGQVVEAVRALYGAHDPAQQAQANHWLTTFQQSPEAWQIPFALLAPEQPDEVQFFAATLLVRKVRSEWSKLDAPSRQALHQAVRAKFQEVLNWPRVSELVLRQQCSLLAAVSGASGGAGLGELTTQALGLLPASTALALHLLTALAQEAEGLDRVRRLALINALMPRARELLAALGALLAAALQQLEQGDRGPEPLATAALRCAEAWLELSPVAGTGCCFAPAELHQQQPQLLGSALALLALRGAGDELLEACVQLLLLLFGPGCLPSDEAADLAATSSLVRSLLACRGRLAEPGSSNTLATGVAKLASALAERSPDFCFGQMPEATELSEVVFEVLARPGAELASHTVDYFLAANTVPLAERPPALRAALYEALLPRLLPHATYPAGFVSWEEEFEVDEDAFNGLREQLLPDLLDVAYGLLRARYLATAWTALQGAASWQAAEAALLLVTAVSLSVKARVLADVPDGQVAGDENSGGNAPAVDAAAEDRRQTRQLLVALFGRVCSAEGGGGMLGAHPMLAAATCRLLEAYSAWFGRAGDGMPLQCAFQLLLRALPIPQATHVAAQAFQQLCLRCSWKLRDAAAFAWLLEAAHGVLRQAGSLPIVDRQLVVEGLARVAAGLQGQQLLDAAARLTEPFLQQAQQAAAAGGGGAAAPDGAARRSLSDSLRLLAAALRFLAPAGDERGELGSQPAAQVLARAAPVLQLVGESPAWRSDAEVCGAAVEVYRRAVGTAKRHGFQIAMAALPAVAALFAATALPACLQVVSEALEYQYEQPGMPAAAMQAVTAACDAALPALQGEALREHPGLVSAMLELAHQCAVYAAAPMLASAALPSLLRLAIAAVGVREAAPVSHALDFVARLVLTVGVEQGEGVGQAHLDALNGVLAAHGAALVAALLAAVCDTCPRHLMRAAADSIRRLLMHPVLRQQAAGWLAAAAASPQLPGLAGGYLTPADCATFAAVAPQLHGPRFLALVVDFGLLARGCNTSDVLLAYEL